MELAVVIPAYEPNDNLTKLVDSLNAELTNFKMIIVNDGSCKSEALQVFKEVATKPNVHLIEYDVNKGKGYALKTAFEYIKSLGNECVIVTADSDGQHSPVDIKRVYDSI